MMKVYHNPLLCIIASIFLLAGCKSPSTETKPPNIILVLVDDLGWKDLGFMGSKLYQTPHIDRLASEGMIFTNAYAACAVCSPTRASVLTGKYPARLGITDWIRGRFSGVEVPSDRKNPTGYDTVANRALLTPKNPLWMESEEFTIAEALKQRGYTTGHIGKWHLGPDEWRPEGQGFDYNYGGTDYGQPPSYFDPYEANGYSIENLPGRKKGEYLTDREGIEATRFIRQHHTQPFFLNLWHYTVHTPLQAKTPLINKYTQLQASDPSLPDFREEDDYRTHFQTKVPLDSQRNAVYAAMIESLDNAMGRILHTLDSLSIRENTMIIFFSDNGGHIVSTSNAPLRLGKGHPYEGGIREPLIISWLGKIQSGTQSDIPVISNDFMATICRTVGADMPETDGLDLTPVLNQSGTLDREDLFWHFPHYWWGDKVRPYSAVRSGDWKLIRHYEKDKYELFNLREDIGESQNLAAQMPEKVAALTQKLDAWLASVNAKMPVPNPEFIP